MNKESKMIGTWEYWHPIEYKSKTLDLVSLADNKKGLTLTYYDYKNPKVKIIVNFSTPVLSYRNTTEENSMGTSFDLSKKYGPKFIIEGFFFRAKNSKYIQWLYEQNGGIYNLLDVTHYAFITTEEITEVLSLYPPKVTWVE